MTITSQPIHTKDADCTNLDADGSCIDCGVTADDPCVACGGVRFHTDICRNRDGFPTASFLNVWRSRLAAAASAASQVSRRDGGPLLTADSTTAQVEAWLQWNDPNGAHLPELAEAEGFEPYTDEEAWDAMGNMILDTASPEWRAEYLNAVEEAMIAERGEADRIAAARQR